MKKMLLILFILLLFFGGYIIYDSKFKDKIPILSIEEEVINIDEIYIYGTHLNLHGSIVEGNNLQLVLYDGEFIEFDINQIEDGFNLSDYVNSGLYLEDIPRGNYFMFLRDKFVDDDGNEQYKYYSLNNISDYEETVYYTFSNKNNKIVIDNEETYPTMKINVSENTDENVYDIVIDPGHGGIDGGADRYGYKESDFTLDLSLKIKDILEDKGLKVKLTHDVGQLSQNDRLEEYGTHGRAVVSYEVKAKYVFSIHFNSNVSSSVNGLEVYTADNINYDFAKKLVDNIVSYTGLNYSSNKINNVFNGLYTRTFTESDIESSIQDYFDNNRQPYDISTKSNYYYIIRETGGIVTGAYVDDRNDDIIGNPYVKSNVGAEAYLMELGYISNKDDLDNLISNMDKYSSSIADSILLLNVDYNV